MSVIEFVENNLFLDNPLIGAVSFALITLIVHDTYHSLITAVFSWFKK